MKKEIAKKSNDHHLKLSTYYIYIIECENGSLYTGITTDINRRFEEHRDKKLGAKYTKAFKPKKIVAAWATRRTKRAHNLAAKLEYNIKRLKRNDKLLLSSGKKEISDYYLDLFNEKDFIRLDISQYEK